MKDLINIIDFVKNELKSISSFEYVVIDFGKEIFPKLKKEFSFNTIQELRSFIIENGPDFSGFHRYDLTNLKRELELKEEDLKYKSSRNSSKDELKEDIKSIREEIKKFPSEDLKFENDNKKKQVEFLLEVLFNETFHINEAGYCYSPEEKNERYAISKIEDEVILNEKYFNNTSNGDIKNWRQELLTFFNDKLPEVTPAERLRNVAPTLLAIKNGLINGQAIVSDDNSIYLHISKGFMANINFYKKKFLTNYFGIHYPRIYTSPFFKGRPYFYENESYSDGYIGSWPYDLIFSKKENLIHVNFDTSLILK